MDIKLNVIELMSPLHGKEKVKESLSKTYEFFNDNFDPVYIEYEDINEKWEPIKGALTVVWVMTGGTEEKFRTIYDFLPKPVILLAENINNSLAASLEILSYIREYKKDKAYLLCGDKSFVLDKVKRLSKIAETLAKIEASNIGSIGGPSEWLISSHINYTEVKKRWGINIVDISMDELYYTLKNVTDDYDGYFERALRKVEPDDSEIKKAHWVYVALKSLAEKYKLDALTLKCFDLLMKFKTTGCLALSRLSDEGIIAGCEGDLPSTFTMFFANLLTGEIPFMANPSSIDKNKNTIIFAHCTVPTRAVKNYVLRSHFESGIGVGIGGEFDKGPVTILKFGGEDLSKISFAEGRILDNPQSEFRCRTQIEVFLEKDVEDFVSSTLGNHQIIISGDYVDYIKDLIYFKNISV